MPDKIENESTRVIKIDILTPPNEAIIESDYNQNPFFREKWIKFLPIRNFVDMNKYS